MWFYHPYLSMAVVLFVLRYIISYVLFILSETCFFLINDVVLASTFNIETSTCVSVPACFFLDYSSFQVEVYVHVGITCIVIQMRC